jgi:hypothetical protein
MRSHNLKILTVNSQLQKINFNIRKTKSALTSHLDLVTKMVSLCRCRFTSHLENWYRKAARNWSLKGPQYLINLLKNQANTLDSSLGWVLALLKSMPLSMRGPQQTDWINRWEKRLTKRRWFSMTNLTITSISSNIKLT